MRTIQLAAHTLEISSGQLIDSFSDWPEQNKVPEPRVAAKNTNDNATGYHRNGGYICNKTNYVRDLHIDVSDFQMQVGPVIKGSGRQAHTFSLRRLSDK